MGFSRARNQNLSPSELDLLPKQSARRCSLETTLYATATRAGRRSGPGFRRTKGCFTRSRAQCIRCSEIHGGFRAGSYPKSNIEFRRYGFFVIEILRSCNHNHFPFSFPMAGTALHASHCHVLASHFAYCNGTEARRSVLFLLTKEKAMSHSDRDAASAFRRILDRTGSAFLSAKNHLRETWQTKVHAVEKLSRHRRHDDTRG